MGEGNIRARRSERWGGRVRAIRVIIAYTDVRQAARCSELGIVSKGNVPYVYVSHVVAARRTLLLHLLYWLLTASGLLHQGYRIRVTAWLLCPGYFGGVVSGLKIMHNCAAVW